ncbi:MAG: cytochrome c [Proteobacteria bacterium]|nr:cytochrome c [Pseudomonadota bacterium]MDA1011761.1 cytochrome c [Pseudomonadota bacterium]
MVKKTLLKRTMAEVIGSMVALSLLVTLDISFNVTNTAHAERPKIKKRGPGGRQLFDRYCITCHKYMGQGGHSEGGWGKNLRKTPLPREMLMATIKYGRTQLGMPAFEGNFSDANLYIMTDFILGELRCKEPPEESLEWKIGCQEQQ